MGVCRCHTQNERSWGGGSEIPGEMSVKTRMLESQMRRINHVCLEAGKNAMRSADLSKAPDDLLVK